MTEWFSDFQFLRPAWLLLLPLLILWLLWWHQRRPPASAGDWHKIIAPELLAPLLPEEQKGQAGQGRKRGLWLPTFLLGLTVLALAGPSWREAPKPAQQPADALVVVLDLSLSMLARDLEPDRLTQGKRALQDVLRLREGAETALIAYAGDAHVVTPLTRDRATIEAFLPALDPYLMPSYGGRADRGVQRAVALLEHSGPGRRQILLITDGMRDKYLESIHDVLSGHRIHLQILATGTESGAPVPLEDRGVIREDGQPVIVATRLSPLQALAHAHGGEALRWQGSGMNLEPLALSGTDSAHRSDARGWLREDGGYWLLLIIVPLALWGWRRGHPALAGYSSVIFSMAMTAILTVNTAPAVAAQGGLWHTPDQQAMARLPEAPAEAAKLFRDPRWQALAHFRAGNHAAAAALWAGDDSAEGHYNRGNALAHDGRIQEAIAAYETALARRGDFTQARENRERLVAFLEAQKEQTPPEKNSRQQQEEQPPGGNPQPGGSPPADATGKREQRGTQAEGAQAEDGSATAPVEAADESRISRDLQRQTREQWLRRIPDDSASLLRRKFARDYQQRQQQRQQEQEPQELW